MKDFMRLMNMADDAGLPFIKQMSREQRNKFLQEYVDVSEFRKELQARIDAEHKDAAPAEMQSKYSCDEDG